MMRLPLPSFSRVSSAAPVPRAWVLAEELLGAAGLLQEATSFASAGSGCRKGAGRGFGAVPGLAWTQGDVGFPKGAEVDRAEPGI